MVLRLQVATQSIISNENASSLHPSTQFQYFTTVSLLLYRRNTSGQC